MLFITLPAYIIGERGTQCFETTLLWSVPWLRCQTNLWSGQTGSEKLELEAWKAYKSISCSSSVKTASKKLSGWEGMIHASPFPDPLAYGSTTTAKILPTPLLARSVLRISRSSIFLYRYNQVGDILPNPNRNPGCGCWQTRQQPQPTWLWRWRKIPNFNSGGYELIIIISTSCAACSLSGTVCPRPVQCWIEQPPGAFS